jgi:transcriptional regulator with XRE-family HTH domain
MKIGRKQFMDRDENECRELLSRNIKLYRGRLGVSQLDLALELDISTTFLSDIETCKKWVSPKTLALIAKVLKVEIYELFKPNEENLSPILSAEVVKYLDSVDDTLVKQITHSIEPAIERTITRSVAKMRKFYEKQLLEGAGE